MKPQPEYRYRGEVLTNIAVLTETEIEERIRHAAKIDRGICRLLSRYRTKYSGDKAARVIVDAVQAWADIGLASIAAAEHRREVSVFTRARDV